MAIKELLTRIALKYDTYANWTDPNSAEGKGKNLVLLKGEIGICEIPSANSDSNVAPTVLFKVGDGTKTFENLPWASAKAADVYDWAKSETVVLDGTTIKFKTGNTVKHTIDLSSFATDAEVATIKQGIEQQIARIEASLGTNGDIGKAIDDVEARLDVIEGDAETKGSIAHALTDAHEYASTCAASMASAAETAAKTHANTEIAKDRERLTAIEGVNTTQGTAISANDAAIKKEVTDRATAVSNEATTRANADTAINEKIGGSYSKTATVHAAIVDAKQAGTDAANAVNTLKTTEVKANADAISANATKIATNTQAIADEKTARENADSALDTRVAKIETFIGAADADGKDGGLYDALDTLAEIQKYITDEGTAADQMVKDIAENAKDIAALEKEFGTSGRVTAAETTIAQNAGNITTLQNLTSGYTGTGAIKNAIDAAKKAGDDAAKAAKTADDKAVAAQGDVDDLAAVVNHATTGLAKTKEIADGAASEASRAHSRLATVEGNITTIQGIVSTGADANSKLRSAITELQGIVKTGANANATLRSDLTALTTRVTTAEGTLATTTTTANAAKTAAEGALERIAIIEGDYLKAADEYIFGCGTSTTVIHKK
jgi:hypothetical protein